MNRWGTKVGAGMAALLALLVFAAASAARAAPIPLPEAHVGGFYGETAKPACPDQTVGCPILVGVTGSVPPGLGYTMLGNQITGVPLKAGDYVFTVTVQTLGHQNASQDFSIHVVGDDSVVLDVSPASVPDGQVGQPYGGGVRFQAVGIPLGAFPNGVGVDAGALPPGLDINGNGFLQGTPTAAGTYHFTIGVADTLGHSGERDYTLTIAGGPQQPVTVSPGALPAGQVAAAYSQTLAASGGDGGPYTFTRTGALPAGLTLGSDGTLSGTPTAAGTFTFTATATDGAGATGAQTYTLTILAADGRPDPSQAPDVRGLVAAQAQAAQQFAQGQMDNVGGRMDRLHGESCRRPFDNGLRVAGPGGDGETRTLGLPGADGRCGAGLSAWAGGTVDLGHGGPAGGARRDFVSVDLTTGVDYRFSDRFAAGLAFGYGSDGSDIGGNGTASRGTAWSATLYGSFQATPSLFVDALAGYGSFSFDSRRYDAGAGAFATGRRGGEQVYGSLTAGYETVFGIFRLTPFARLSASSSRLDPFTETGAGIYSLTFGPQSVASLAGAFGIRGATDIPTDFGTVSPRFRLDYTHEFEGGGGVAVGYAAPPGAAYGVNTPPFARDLLSIGVGVDFRLAGAATIGLDYAGSFGLGGGGESHAFGLSVSERF